MTFRSLLFPLAALTLGACATVESLPNDRVGETTLRFANVQPGTYAIALLHDENDNGKADRVLGMMPREGFGFSNDAPVNMGPPSFGDAAIQVGARELHQTIRMRYML